MNNSAELNLHLYFVFFFGGVFCCVSVCVNLMESCCFYLPLRPLDAINLLLKFPIDNWQ